MMENENSKNTTKTIASVSESSNNQIYLSKLASVTVIKTQTHLTFSI